MKNQKCVCSSRQWQLKKNVFQLAVQYIYKVIFTVWIFACTVSSHTHCSPLQWLKNTTISMLLVPIICPGWIRVAIVMAGSMGLPRRLGRSESRLTALNPGSLASIMHWSPASAVCPNARRSRRGHQCNQGKTQLVVVVWWNSLVYLFSGKR